MQRKRLYIIITSSMLLIGLLAAAWWGWSKAGLAVLQLGVGVC